MLFRQILHDDLGCASYLLGDSGQAAVVDPQWEIAPYLRLAAEQGLAIGHILETHNHADHVSGRGRLAAATGAHIHISAKAGVDYAHQPLADGDAVVLGRVRIVALSTPGHRPEHTTYLIEDTSRSESPWLALTGDSLFVGDLARPDLAVEPAEGARGLFRSLGRLLQLEDLVEVWPGHIGGSMCGGAGMSLKPGSTIGFERRFNHLARIEDESDFVRRLTTGLGDQPPNLARIVAINRGPLVVSAATLEPLAPRRVRQLLSEGAILIDGRAPRDHDTAHVPGAINVSMVRAAVGTRAAWVLDPERDLVLMGASDEDARRLGRMLEAVGLMRLRGYLSGGIAAWREAGQEIARTAVIAAAELAERLGSEPMTLLDVRERPEWEAGHVPGSLHAPYHELRLGPPAGLEHHPGPIAVICSTGNRSALAASLLRRAGGHDVLHVADGGVAELEAAGVTLTRGA